MKALSFKLDEDIFKDVEKITYELKIARNRYINDAINMYNNLFKKRVLKKQLRKESKLVHENSMRILKEFELLDNEMFGDED